MQIHTNHNQKTQIHRFWRIKDINSNLNSLKSKKLIRNLREIIFNCYKRMRRFALLFLLINILGGISLAQNVPIQIIRLELTLSGQIYTDETVIYTDSSATLEWDSQYDAEKIDNSAPQPNLASFINDTLRASINAIPPLALQTTIPISVTTGISGNYTITATELSNFPGGADVVLDDSTLSVSQSLFITPAYSFTFNETDPDDRFYLNLFPAPTAIDKYFANQPELKLLMMDNQFQFRTSGTWGDIQDISVYNINGEKIGVSCNISDNMCTVKYSGNIASGIYLLAIRATNRELSHKFFVR